MPWGSTLRRTVPNHRGVLDRPAARSGGLAASRRTAWFAEPLPARKPVGVSRVAGLGRGTTTVRSRRQPTVGIREGMTVATATNTACVSASASLAFLPRPHGSTISNAGSPGAQHPEQLLQDAEVAAHVQALGVEASAGEADEPLLGEGEMQCGVCGGSRST